MTTSKQLIRSIIEHDHPHRIGHSFSKKSDDFYHIGAARFVSSPDQELLSDWGRHEELLAQAPGFRGDVRRDPFGNIYGRLEGKSKGECVRGALQGGWEMLDGYELPHIDMSHYDNLMQRKLREEEKFVTAGFPLSVFSNLRDARLMGNALVDTLAEPENVEAFLHKIRERSFQIIEGLGRAGCDAIMMADDWGTQDRTFISPASFREVFKPTYRIIADAVHLSGMKFILHSCGYIYAFIEDLIDAGIDVFQFDQIELYGTERLAKEFGSRATFFSPVDIQKVLPTGDRAYIEKTALEMVNNFKSICQGSLIVKDYPSYGDIDVQEEWADWAREVVLQNSEI